jgi:two-component system KDP operon response regulator KdpE
VRNAATILIIDDDERIRNYIRTLLTGDGYSVLETGNATTALSIIASHSPDLVILDLGLPDFDGQQLLKEMRAWSGVPVVVVSARDLEKDKVDALDSGADDYITKPFGSDELLARIRAALRHGAQQSEGRRAVFSARGLTVDMERRIVRVDDEPVHLTQIEYKIVTLLCKNAGKVLTHDHMIREVWGPFSNCDTQLLRVNMANIRRKIERDPSVPEYITTEIGVGYRMIAVD